MQNTDNLIALGPYRDRKSAERGGRAQAQRTGTGSRFSRQIFEMAAPAGAFDETAFNTYEGVCGFCPTRQIVLCEPSGRFAALEAIGWTTVRHPRDLHDWNWMCPCCSTKGAA